MPRDFFHFPYGEKKILEILGKGASLSRKFRNFFLKTGTIEMSQILTHLRM